MAQFGPKTRLLKGLGIQKMLRAKIFKKFQLSAFFGFQNPSEIWFWLQIGPFKWAKLRSEVSSFPTPKKGRPPAAEEKHNFGAQFFDH